METSHSDNKLISQSFNMVRKNNELENGAFESRNRQFFEILSRSLDFTKKVPDKNHWKLNGDH